MKQLVSRNQLHFVHQGEAEPGLRVFREVWQTDLGEEVLYKYSMPDAVIIVPFTAGGNVVAVSEFRPALGQEHLHLPGGSILLGEDPLSAVYRKLQEEIGYQAGRARITTSILADSVYSDRVIHIAEADNCIPIPGYTHREGAAPFVYTPREFWERMMKYYALPELSHGGGHSLKAAAFIFSDRGILHI